MSPTERQIRFWRTVLEIALCGLLGLAAGVMFTLGYFADLPPWLK